ncbi:MAG: PD40 domain-containing protein, partial [Verrucomicrobia bacterium]|nr:PD40 domain-containing protein [Verrucomicrobiota bacterium]
MTCLTFSLASFDHLILAAQEPPRIEIEKEGDRSKLIPISLSGFSGEVQKVLRDDLEIQGFDIVAADIAQFNVTGSNTGAVEGRVTDRIRKTTVLANRYQGGTLRSQTHALADDIIQKITGKPGVSRTKIAYVGETGGRREIFIADYDGANAQPATQDSANVATVCWAPGGKKLFYTSYKSGYPDIYSHDLVSGQRIAIARYSGSNISPAVSPDGRHVAMIISKDGNPELYVCNVDGTNARRLTQTAADESSPCWSPDSQTICVVSRQGGTPALYEVPAAGG